MMTTTTTTTTSPSSTLRLITNSMCPFAQKAWIALECSGLPFELQEIALYGARGKPDWFWELNPAGTVPVLVVMAGNDKSSSGGRNSNDSSSSSSNKKNKDNKNAVVAVFPDSDLILQAVADGSLIAACSGQDSTADNNNNNNHNPLAYYQDNKQQQQQQESIQQWRQAINQMLPIGKKAVLGGQKHALQQYLHDQLECRFKNDDDEEKATTSFLVGNQVTIADCHAFPFLWRLDQEYNGGLANGLHCPQLGAWVERCSQIPAFAKTLPASSSSWWWWW